jgi:hypothetical protein
MVWSGVSMTVGKHVARLVAAVLAVPVAIAVVPAGVAMAAPPNVTIDDPLTGSSTTDQTPPFSGTTDDVLDPVTLNIYPGASAGGLPVQTLTVLALLELGSLEGAWAAEPESALEPGQYTAVAEQTNLEPQAGQSAPVTFTVDTTPPAVSLDPVPSPTNDSTPTLTGGAGTATGDASTVAVAIYEGGSVSGGPVRTEEVTVSGSTWTAGPVASLPDGTYTALAEQSDEAGNTGKSTAVTFTVDTTPPAVSLGSVASPTNDPSPTLAGSADVGVGDESTVMVRIYEGGSVGGASVASKSVSVSGGGWSYTPPNLADGTYTASVSQGDAAGNVGTSAAVTFTVDTSAPVIAVTAPTAGAALSTSKPTVSGLAGQANGDDPSVTLKLYAGSTVSPSPLQTNEVTPSGASWTIGVASALADGTYTVLAEQSDQAGNTGTSAAVTFTIDTTLPAVTLTSPAKDSSTSTEFESFSGAAGSSTGDQPQVTVKLFAGSAIASGAPLKEVTVPVVSGRWSAAFGGLGSGTYTARAQQNDDIGRTSFSEPVTFTVNIPGHSTPPVTPPAVSAPSAQTTPSTPPVASFHWFPSAPHTGEAISLVSTSTDATSPIIGFAWSVAGDGIFGGGSSALTTSFSAPGAHVVLLRVTDANGLSSVVAETIPVTAPAPTLMQPFPVVRIAGSENASGVRVGLLTVQTPVGATVNVSCRGHGCPARSQNVVATSGRSKSTKGMVVIALRRFERTLRAGTVLEIRVSKSGKIGKYTRFAVRRGKLPARVDTCLSPAGVKPIVCPSS